MQKSRGSFKIFVLFGLRKPEDSRRRAKKKPRAQRDQEQMPHMLEAHSSDEMH